MGEPTTAARMAQARAFIALCMMDRAWIRLKELTDGGDGGIDAHVLTAQMFIARGWPSRGKKPLEAAMKAADDRRMPELEALWLQTEQPAAPLPENEPEGDDVATLLPIAEKFLAMGAYLKAQRLLERLKRLVPDDQRIADLLWVLQGDFTLGGEPFAAVAERLAPPMAPLAEIGDDVEHTESVKRASLEELDAHVPEDEPSFPALFRQPVDPELTPQTAVADESTEEVTQASSMASAEQLRDAFVASRAPSTEGDTQIARVIHRDGSAPDVAPADGPIHKVPDETASAFDLAAFRREMGMKYASSPDYEGPEQEDDDLIILTKREHVGEEASSGGLDSSLELDTTTSEVRKAIEAEKETPRPQPPQKKPAAQPRPSMIEPPPRPEAVPTQPPTERSKRPKRARGPLASAAPWWMLAIGMLVLLSFALASMLLINLLAHS